MFSALNNNKGTPCTVHFKQPAVEPKRKYTPRQSKIHDQRAGDAVVIEKLVDKPEEKSTEGQQPIKVIEVPKPVIQPHSVIFKKSQPNLPDLEKLSQDEARLVECYVVLNLLISHPERAAVIANRILQSDDYKQKIRALRVI